MFAEPLDNSRIRFESKEQNFKARGEHTDTMPTLPQHLESEKSLRRWLRDDDADDQEHDERV